MKPSIFCLFILLNSMQLQAQSKIEQSKNELKTETKTTPKTTASTNTNNSTDDRRVCNNNISRNNSNNSLSDELFSAFGDIFWASIFGYKSRELHLQNNISPYPYFNNQSGNYTIHSTHKKWRIDIENNILTSYENIYGNHFLVNLRPIEDFYFKGEYYQLIEKNKKANNPNLALFNYSFCYDRIRTQNFNLGWNIGLNYVGSGVNKSGFAVGLQTDIFINRFMNISSSATWSQINQQPVNSFDIKYKCFLDRYSFQAGYTQLQIATPNYQFFSIGVGVSLN